AQNNLFANELNFNDDTLVVGAPGNNSQTGAAYIFKRNQGGAENWGEVQELTASDGAQNDLFGVSSAIFADTVLIGAPGHNSNTGAVYVFSRNQGGADNWGQVQELTDSE